MRTSSVLFGLITAACASSQPHEPSYPLCDDHGAPACGNIGQVGRSTQPATPTPRRAVVTATELAATAAASAASAATTVPVVQVLLSGAAHQHVVSPVARPLVDNREQVVCGNVLGKGGRRRVCHDSATSALTSNSPIVVDAETR